MTSAATPPAWGDPGPAWQPAARLVMLGVPPGAACLPGDGADGRG
jgi:hypothetical protein